MIRPKKTLELSLLPSIRSEEYYIIKRKYIKNLLLGELKYYRDLEYII